MSDDEVRNWLIAQAQHNGYARLDDLAAQFRKYRAAHHPRDKEFAQIIRTFVYCVEKIGTVTDKDELIDLASRCGWLRAEIHFRYGIDPQTDRRREKLLNDGRAFRSRKSGQRRPSRHKSVRDQQIIEQANKLLRSSDFGRFKNGGVNISALADSVMRVGGHRINKTRARSILSSAIARGKLTI